MAHALCFGFWHRRCDLGQRAAFRLFRFALRIGLRSPQLRVLPWLNIGTAPATARAALPGPGVDISRFRPYISIQLYNYLGIPVATDSLTTTLSALADPTRRAIVARLALGEA